MMVYNNRPHSYRELPIRIAELGTMQDMKLVVLYQDYNVYVE